MADNWEVVSGYETNDYTDTVAFEMDEGTKRLKEVSGQALVAGEKNSQYIRFMIPRYCDGIDVSEKDISIVYGLAGKYYGESAVVSVERTDDRLRFGWIVPEGACCVEGTLLFAVIVKDDTYTLKSQIVEKNVFKSINIDDIAPEPTREAWYKEFQARVDQALTNAESTLSEAQDVVAEARAYVGAPLVARTADDFEDTDRIYVYTGSEEGYNAGHWYYWRGTAMAWIDGGVYNATAVDTDTTLTIAGKAADAKEVGDQLTSVKEDLNAVFVTDSANGSVAHFVDGADDVPMKSVKVNIAPVQSGSGDPSPSNVRPISGHSGTVSVYHSGEDTSEPTEYSVSLTEAGTVYGGTLDVVSGLLTVDRRFFNAKDKNWAWGGGTYAYTVVNDTDKTQKTEVVSSTFKYHGGAGTVDGCVSWGGSPNNGNLIVRSAQVAPSLSDWNSYIASNDVTFVYYLAEPQTIQLTATEIKSLLGINNVWSDSGDVDVEYRADTKLYIDKRLGV